MRSLLLSSLAAFSVGGSVLAGGVTVAVNGVIVQQNIATDSIITIPLDGDDNQAGLQPITSATLVSIYDADAVGLPTLGARRVVLQGSVGTGGRVDLMFLRQAAFPIDPETPYLAQSRRPSGRA